MKKLRLLILIFCVALTVPLAYFVLRTYRSLEQEEVAELRYFAETLFDKMEEELGALVLTEEARAIDEYKHHYIPGDQVSGWEGTSPSPLSRPPEKPYILGYFQNDPDGSFQTPLVESGEKAPAASTMLVGQLKDVNEIFNLKRTSVPQKVEVQPAETFAKGEREKPSSFADRYLSLSRSQKQKVHLGQEKKRVEQITADKALNLAQRDDKNILGEGRQQVVSEADQDMALDAIGQEASRFDKERGFTMEETEQTEPSSDLRGALPLDNEKLQVEVDPMQSVFVNDLQVFIFRRIVINNQVYRQGFVLMVEEFLNHLAGQYFVQQPMSRFASLDLKVMDQGREVTAVQAGATSQHPSFSLNRTFPRPFSFLRAMLTCDQIPRSAGRKTLSIMMVVLGAIILLGLFAIYQSAQAIVALSERRSSFVSSVTHEVKTPLTNIRMYIEMLEQGIARDQEREQEYFRILGSESSRLSRLINNVLEFSKLEKKQRHLDLQEGIFEEVIQEVKDVMREKLRQEDFTLTVEINDVPPFKYDREAMVQVLINLMENSMKFGKGSPVRKITLRIWPEGDRMKISASDTGPGIPRHALKKVFDDFYRVDSSLTRTTRGTGIGLALVKKFVLAMNGSITATNNDGPGCTITISLPA
jgi:signal transduction histidine kinase